MQYCSAGDLSELGVVGGMGLSYARMWPQASHGLVHHPMAQRLWGPAESSCGDWCAPLPSPFPRPHVRVQVRWVYGEEAPLWLLEEVEGQLERAYAFIVDREAEAPHQYQAIQSYR